MNSIYNSTMEDPKAAAANLRAATLHHVGFVVASIAKVAELFADSVGSQWDGNVIHDPLQKARVTFFRSTTPGPLIELVEPADQDSPVSAFAGRGGGLHHLCYEVDCLDSALEAARSLGGLVVRRPLPAVAFGGRRIAWVLTSQRLLLEYLDAKKGTITTLKQVESHK